MYGTVMRLPRRSSSSTARPTLSVWIGSNCMKRTAVPLLGFALSLGQNGPQPLFADMLSRGDCVLESITHPCRVLPGMPLLQERLVQQNHLACVQQRHELDGLYLFCCCILLCRLELLTELVGTEHMMLCRCASLAV